MRSTYLASASERALSADEQHGFLWRLNTYWSYEERDGGLYLQVESVSLTRSIPHGLGWMVGPFIETIPRESLEFTLRSTCSALRKLSIERRSAKGEQPAGKRHNDDLRFDLGRRTSSIYDGASSKPCADSFGRKAGPAMDGGARTELAEF